MAYNNKSILGQFRQLNFLAAVALSLFAFVTLVQVGVAGMAIEYLEKYKFLPLTAMFASVCMIFAASGTRDPRHYHPVEWAIIFVTATIFVLNAFLAEVNDFMMSAWPYAQIVLFVLSMVAAAIIAR